MSVMGAKQKNEQVDTVMVAYGRVAAAAKTASL